MEFLAPAKINLSLIVKGPRPDGFHEIETLMVPVTLFDHLEIELRATGGLTFACTDPAVPADETNLVVRAATLFCAETGLEPHLGIILRKTIPSGAGLGGGSSDAATTLLALNHLFGTRLPRETLVSMAADLGSDIPFFIHQRAALCRGRGEQCTPIDFPHRLPLLLIKPPFVVPTPWAYQRWSDAQAIPGVPDTVQALAWGELRNDLERPVFEKYLFLATLKRWLLAQPEVEGALMSGSGSTLFAVLREKTAASALGETLAREFGPDLWCFLAETISQGSMPDS